MVVGCSFSVQTLFMSENDRLMFRVETGGSTLILTADLFLSDKFFWWKLVRANATNGVPIGIELNGMHGHYFWGRGGYKMGKLQVQNFSCPTHLKTGYNLLRPDFKGWKLPLTQAAYIWSGDGQYIGLEDVPWTLAAYRIHMDVLRTSVGPKMVALRSKKLISKNV